MTALSLSRRHQRSDRFAAGLVVAVFIVLALVPFLFEGSQPLNVAAKICYFIVLAASFDLLLGYTGIVSFAHAMFFGIGGYGAAIALSRLGAGWGVLFLGTAGALVFALALALLIGFFSLRVRAIFFAMITLAIASAFAILASQLSGITGGEDGLSFSLPAVLSPGHRLFAGPVLGVRLSGRHLTYWLVFAASILLFLAMRRLVGSPFGRVLEAIRENEFRAEALGYRTLVYRLVVNGLAAMIAALAGVLCALWLRYTGPDTTLSFDIMLDILLMVVIGGMGTLYGAVIGAVLLILAESYLRTLMGGLAAATAGWPVLPQLFNPDRWLLWLGILFILCVYFFPRGIVGRLHRW